MNIRTILEFTISAVFLGFILCAFMLSCEDKYLTIERRVIDAENKVPVYFYAQAEQAGENTWRPIFTYYIYVIEEEDVEFDVYFHAYCVDGDSVVWSGVQAIQSLAAGKKIYGQYVSDAEFQPEMIQNVTPMAYVSVESK